VVGDNGILIVMTTALEAAWVDHVLRRRASGKVHLGAETSADTAPTR
jgi:hypothetical protein